MRAHRIIASTLAALFVCSTLAAQTTRVSVSSSGAQANEGSLEAAISADGRYVVFNSSATNLSQDDPSGGGIFLHDRQTRQTRFVGARGVSPSVSRDGRFVVYTDVADLRSFVWERATNQTVQLPGQGTGILADVTAGAAISANGRFIVFMSDARPRPIGFELRSVFLLDREQGRVTKLHDEPPGFGYQQPEPPAISGDGSIVVFRGFTTAPQPHMRVYDHSTGEIKPLPFPTGGNVSYERPALSEDGRYVAFAGSGDLLPGQANSVFVHDRLTGTTTIASVASDGARGNGNSRVPSLSADGRFIAFSSRATNLVPGDTNGVEDVFLHDRATGRTIRVSIAPDGGQATAQSILATRVAQALTADGRHLVFASFDLGLVAPEVDSNNRFDVFVRDTFDVDRDGLPTNWEAEVGLDPDSASGIDGADGDPDGDGKSNAQELAAGSHPRGTVTRYFAEGATSSFFYTRVTLLNPARIGFVPTGRDAARVVFRFLDATGRTTRHWLIVPPRTRRTINVPEIAGLATAEFSTIVESDNPVIVDRTMWWDRTSAYGAHAETAIVSPAPVWHLAEGATHSGFNLFYLVQNPGDLTADVEVRYLRPAPAAPLVKRYALAPRSRFNIWVNREDPGLASTDVSAVLTSSADRPIIVERAMYLDSPGRAFNAGHESAGVTTPSPNWFLAEGATGDYFDLFILIANPNPTVAEVSATYLLPSGNTLTKQYSVAANSRFSIWVDREDPALADTAVSTRLSATNGVPIVVERSMWWPGPTAATWHEAHNSAGATATGTRWGIAEGEVLGAPPLVDTYLLIANTSAYVGTVMVLPFFEDGTPLLPRYFQVNANSRFNVDMRAEFPGAVGKVFGAIIESVGSGGPPAQIVVERAIYSNSGGVRWAAGTNALATRLLP